MAFNTGSGTAGDPYIIESVSMWNNEMYDEATGKYFRVQADTDLDFVGGFAQVVDNDKDVDLNGNALLNIGNFRRSSFENNLCRQGTIHNGRIDVNVTRDASGGLKLFFGDGGVESSFDNLRFTGSLTNTNATGTCSPFGAFYSGATYENIINEMTVEGQGNVAGMVSGIQSSPTVNECISVATLVNGTNGTATLYGFNVDPQGTATITNCFWDNTSVTNNGTASDITGKSTADLQSITTYTDTNTVGLTSAYSMATLSNYTNEDWAIDDGNAYPVLSFDFVAPEEPTLTVTIDSVAESGVDVVLMQFDDKTLLNPVVIDKGVTDVNGDYTYSGGIDTAKVFGYIVNKPNSGDISLANGAFRLATLNVS